MSTDAIHESHKLENMHHSRFYGYHCHWSDVSFFFFAILAENLVILKELQDIDMLYFNLYDKITLIMYDHVVQFILH